MLFDLPNMKHYMLAMHTICHAPNIIHHIVKSSKSGKSFFFIDFSETSCNKLGPENKAGPGNKVGPPIGYSLSAIPY